MPLDHGADEAELLDGAGELLGRGIGRLHRQRGEAGKARRIFGASRGEMIVDFLRHRHAVRAGHEVGPRTAVREHLDVDAGFVHGLEPRFAEIGQQRQRIADILARRPRLITAAGHDGFVDAGGSRGDRKMLFR